MNPYEVSQASSDAIQSLLDAAHKLHDQTRGSLHQIAQQLKLRITQLQQVHSKSWHILRHNNEHAEFIMARLESMDVLCGRLIPLMSSARAIHSHKMKLKKSGSFRYGYHLLIRKETAAPPEASCCFAPPDKLMELLEGINEELGGWLDRQEEGLELLSCQAFGVFTRVQPHSLEGYKPVPKIMRQVADALIYGSQRCIVVHGPSGVGKSSLASFVAANPPERFSDGVVEVYVGKTFGEEEKLVARLRHLLQELHGHHREQKVSSLSDCWSLLEKAVLETSHLIVLDGVSEPVVVNQLMRLKFHSCKFFITCQDAPVSYDPDNVHLIPLGFKETASVSREVLNLHTGARDVSKFPATASKLLRYCSHHPLAVSILGEALRGSWRKEEWKAVVNHFEVISAGASDREKRRRKTPPNWLTAVFTSIELGTVGLEQETVSLFHSLAALSWSDPVPVECLKALWLAVQEKHKEPSTFLVHARELVRRCLLKRRPDFIFYELHELVDMYLQQKLTKSVDDLLSLSEPATRAVVAPWLLQFGNSATKEAAATALHGIFLLDNEELHAASLLSIVDVLKACKVESSSNSTLNRGEICKEWNTIVGAEIVNLLFRASSPEVYAAITKYLVVCFTDADYDEYGKGLVASGLVDKLGFLLSNKNCSGQVNILVKKDVADVLARFATVCRDDRYVTESLVRSCFIEKLVELLDSRSGWINEAVINAVVKLAGLSEETVTRVLETEFLEKLLLLLQNRKQVIKYKALETLTMMIRVGGSKVVERALELGVLNEVEMMLTCTCEDVQAGSCLVFKEVFLRASEEGLERVLKTSRVVETLTGLFMGEGESQVLMRRAMEAVRVLVLKGDSVRERVVKAAGVDNVKLDNHLNV